MDFRQILYFFSVYNAGSFTRASQNEHVAQPALSTQIARLEKELNVVLFERHAHGVVPTVAGKRFYELAQRIIDDMSTAQAEMARFSASVAGRLRVGLPPSACRAVVGEFLPTYAERYPSVELVLHESFSGTLTQWVADGTVDFAVASKIEDPKGLEFKLLHTEPVVLASNAPEFGPMLAPVDLRRVRALKLVVPLPNHELSRAATRHLRECGVRIERVMHVDGYAATIEMLRNSDWAAVTALSVVYADFMSDEISIHPLVGSSLSYDLCLVRAPHVPLSPAGYAFIHLMQDSFKRYRQRYLDRIQGITPSFDWASAASE